jgi:hypothetical protein
MPIFFTLGNLLPFSAQELSEDNFVVVNLAIFLVIIDQ